LCVEPKDCCSGGQCLLEDGGVGGHCSWDAGTDGGA
jgi:hypothetical protein